MTPPPPNNFWIFLEVLAKRRPLILTLVATITLASVVVALLLPKWFRASALLLPPKDISLPLPGLSRLSEVVSVTQGLDLPVMVTSSDIYARILQSRTIAGRIIEKLELTERYHADNAKEAYEALMDRSEFKVTDEGLLEISAEDHDSVMAAEIANAFVSELDRVNREIAAERLRQNRTFIEERLEDTRQELASAREDFEDFQLKHRTVDFSEQTRLAIEQATNLKVKLAELDIEMKITEKDLTENNTELMELKRRRRIVSDQLRELETRNVDTSFFSLPIASIPRLRGQYEELYSRVRVAESLFRILLEQLERAKIQEKEQTPTITVLDYATPPETKSRPKRTVIVGASFGFSIIMAVFLAALLEYLVRLQRFNPDDYARIQLFIQAFWGWLPGVRKRLNRESERQG